MLQRVSKTNIQPVKADLARLPLRDGSLDGAWAINTYQHLPFAQLPCALAQVHRALAPGAVFEFSLTNLEHIQPTTRDQKRGWRESNFKDQYGERLFTGLSETLTRRLLIGTGFERVTIDSPGEGFWLWIRARKSFTLPDYVRPKLKLLICGLNPSPYAAKTGIPFGRPGNRFWPAALRAKLVERERDPLDALNCGVGFSDLVKRTTRAASELGTEEYEHGLKRLEDLVRLMRPASLCFVGLAGWRAAVERKAQPGWIENGFAGRPAYLMPSTSGLNTHTDTAALARHLRRAARPPAVVR